MLDTYTAVNNIPSFPRRVNPCRGTFYAISVYFSCPQLEEGSVPNRVNMLVNGDFGMVSPSAEGSDYYFPDYWEKKSGILSAKGSHVIMDRAESLLPSELSGNALSLYSRPSRDSVAFGQIIYNRGAKGDCFTVGGWCNARSVAKIPESSIKNAPCIAYRFYDSDTEPGSWKYLNFSREWVGWQFGCWAITAPAAYTRLEIHVNYSRNAQKCMFSNIFVHREQFGKTFAYDDKKNVTSVANLSETKSNMEYDAYDNLTSYTQPGGSDSEKYTMTYGSGKTEKQRHLVRTMTTPEGIKQKFEYDGFGNQTSAETEGTDGDKTIRIKTKSEYTEDGNYLLNTYDPRGMKISRVMNDDGTLASVTDPDNQTINYGYNEKTKRLETVSTISGGNTYMNEYTYENDRLKTVAHNTTDNDSCDVIYTFGYDELGKKTSVKVGNQVLSTNIYSENRSGYLERVVYGNSTEESPQQVVYHHDDFGRTLGMKMGGRSSVKKDDQNKRRRQ